MGEDAKDVTTGEEWVTWVEVVRQAVKILGQDINKVNGKFKILENFTPEETENIEKDFEGRQ